MNRVVRLVALMAASIAASTPAVAQFSVDWAYNGAPQATQLHSSYVMQQIANGTYLKGTGRSSASAKAVPAATATSVTFEAKSRPIAPSRLAQTYPAGMRPQAEQLFMQILDGYRKIEAQSGLKRNDLGGALAAFVGGNWAAYRNEAFPEHLFKPLALQMQGTLQSTGALGKINESEKQELYENLAILGTYMALTREALQKTPNAKIASDMKTASRSNLQQVLRLDPDRMQFTDQGLVVR